MTTVEYQFAKNEFVDTLMRRYSKQWRFIAGTGWRLSAPAFSVFGGSRRLLGWIFLLGALLIPILSLIRIYRLTKYHPHVDRPHIAQL